MEEWCWGLNLTDWVSDALSSSQLINNAQYTGAQLLVLSSSVVLTTCSPCLHLAVGSCWDVPSISMYWLFAHLQPRNVISATCGYPIRNVQSVQLFLYLCWHPSVNCFSKGILNCHVPLPHAQLQYRSKSVCVVCVFLRVFFIHLLQDIAYF